MEQPVIGRDCVGGNWHRHPFENPEAHETTGDSAKDATPEEFLDEVFEILLREKLI
ncbi:MAG: hypothetical protein O8C66_12210 [Candidatus Methanoperedens sp.]|nr:hypothetical protein [Candidatus Methanoperedens sp.]MCZ7371263.1 hypothetical protein [Candidatus Methanoperedens sp.]